MTSSDNTTQDGSARRWAAGTVAAGLLVSAVVVLFSLVAFRSDRPVLWPPLNARVYSVGYGIAGTLALLAVYLVIYVLANAAAAVLGKRPWRDLLHGLVIAAATAALAVTSVSASLQVFYWPWAKASAVRTILSNEAKWRLVTSAEVLAKHWDGDTRQTIAAHQADASPSTQAACAYVLATAGDKASLRRLADAAGDLAPNRADGDAASADNNISSQADVVWLFETLTGFKGKDFSALKDYLDSNLRELQWNPKTRKYASRAAENANDGADAQ